MFGKFVARILFIQSWITPTALFVLLNVVICTIALTSTLINQYKHHHNQQQQENRSQSTLQQQHQQPKKLARSPSLLQRVRSINFYRYRSQEPPPNQPHQDNQDNQANDALMQYNLFQENAQETDTQYFLEQIHEGKAQETTPHQSFKHKNQEKFEAEASKEEEDGELQSLEEVYSKSKGGNVSRTMSDTDPDSGEVPARLPTKKRKSASLKPAFGHIEEEDIVETRRPGTVRERGAKVTEADDEVDAKAHDFIKNYKNQLKLQRLDSIIRDKEETKLSLPLRSSSILTSRSPSLSMSPASPPLTSPNVTNKVAPDVSFEFESLPEYLKRCLSYCSLFPLGYEFERDTLVQLWIAEELIAGEATERMEDKGDECFEILACMEYIVPSRFDKAYGQLKYKVNESKISMWYLDRGSFPGIVRINPGEVSDLSNMTLYLSLSHEKFDPQTIEALQKCKKLRTLLLLGHFGYSVKQVPGHLFLSLKFLRTLDLSGTQISELPSSVGNLEWLRYLDLSYTIIKELPELLCSLESLQTLKLKDCFGLLALPKDMMKLINLRHLDFDIVHQLSSMPKRMGKLMNLLTLKGFIVGIDDGCGIEELSHMNNITGSFCISRLENVSTAEEAKKADLRNKKYLTNLVMRWEECINAKSEEEILECLVPPTGLKELQIQFYSGSVLPSWISNPLFSNIISITLYKCINCRFLPSIGDLPSLKFLSIVAMNKVRDINGLFCGKGPRNQDCYAFSKLEKLILDDMPNLEEWTGVENGDFPCLLHVCIRDCPKLSDIPFMPHLNCLKYMELSHCYELQSLPVGRMPTSLESLIIQDCPKLQARCRKDEGEDWVKIAHVPSIWIDHEEISSVEALLQDQ